MPSYLGVSRNFVAVVEAMEVSCRMNRWELLAIDTGIAGAGQSQQKNVRRQAQRR